MIYVIVPSDAKYSTSERVVMYPVHSLDPKQASDILPDNSNIASHFIITRLYVQQ
jgi:hypothetical protein